MCAHGLVWVMTLGIYRLGWILNPFISGLNLPAGAGLRAASLYVNRRFDGFRRNAAAGQHQNDRYQQNFKGLDHSSTHRSPSLGGELTFVWCLT